MNGPFAVTVVRPAARDHWGDQPDASTHPVEGCMVAPRTSLERVDGRDTVVTGLTLFAPVGADITATDQIEIPGRAGRWQVVGDPADWHHPLTGWRPGLEITLERVKG